MALDGALATGRLYLLCVPFARFAGLREIAATAYGWKISFGAMTAILYVGLARLCR